LKFLPQIADLSRLEAAFKNTVLDMRTMTLKCFHDLISAAVAGNIVTDHQKLFSAAHDVAFRVQGG
jgi:hypothetical protein